jgi:signal transduction histidine kinase
VLVVGTFLLMLVAVSNLQRSANVQARSRNVTSSTLRLGQAVNQLEASLRAYLLSGNERFLGSWRQARRNLAGATRDVDRVLADQPDQRRSAGQLSTMINAYVSEYGLPLITIFHVDPRAARAPVATREGLFRISAIRSHLDSLLTGEAALASADSASARREARRAEMIGIAALVAAAGLLVLFGVFVARRIAGPVRKVASGATRVAEGDLSTRLPEEGPAEILALTSAFNVMASSLEQGKRVLEVQNEELRQSERLKSQLVSIVSHELRNPLTSILGYTSLLLARDFDREESRRYLEIIQQQGNRLTSLIDHFLDSESVASGKLEIALEPLDLKPLLVEEAKLVADKATKHRVEVVIGAETLPVRGDRDRLAQVFANLLGNAVKYSPEGGLVEVGGEIADDVVRVHVRDEGIGVPDEHQPQIFTKFFRGDARESGIAGTGLGLAVSREIIEAHGGQISFTSRAGAGSYFWFELPLDQRPRLAAQLAQAVAKGSSDG